MRFESDRRMRKAFETLAAVGSLLLFLAACGSDSDDAAPDSAGDTTPTSAAPTDSGGSDDSTGDADDTGDTGDDAVPDVVLQGGSATLTIGAETFAFQSFFCGFGHEATESDDLGFAAAGEGTDSDGTPMEIAVQLYDAGLREGFTEVQLLRQESSGDFEIAWTLSDTEPLAVEDPTGRAAVVLDGDSLTIDGGAYVRWEDGAETGEEVQGSLEAVCSPDSFRS